MSSLTPVPLFGGSGSVSIVTMGEHYTCTLGADATLAPGKVLCFGDNTYYQLGIPDGSSAAEDFCYGCRAGEIAALTALDFGTTHVPTLIAAGASHNCGTSLCLFFNCFLFALFFFSLQISRQIYKKRKKTISKIS
jgi:hypothetical protein